MSLKLRKIVSLIFAPLFMVYLELYLRLKSGLWNNESSMNGGALMSAAAFGVCLALACSLTKSERFNRWLALILTELCCLWYCIQYFTNDSYSAFMSPGSVLTGAGGVVTEFRDSIINIIKGNWEIIFLLQLPFILLLTLNILKFTYFKLSGGLFTGLLLLCVFSNSISVEALTSTKLAKEKYTYDFVYDEAVRFLGTVTATRLDLQYAVKGVPAAPYVPEPAPPPPPKPSEYGYNGIFAGKNLITIVVESFSKELIDSGFFPAVSRMAQNGIIIEDFYQPFWGGSTTSGEAAVLLGIIPTEGAKTIQKILKTDNFYTMASRLNGLGYYTAAYHNGDYNFYNRHKTHPATGFQHFVSKGTGMEAYLTNTWPGCDVEMFSCIPDMFTDKQPYYAYILTYSGHGLYNFTGNTIAKRHKAAVENLEGLSTQVKAYIAGSLDFEYGLEYLLEVLEEKDQLKDTVFVITSDHYPYALQKGEAWKNSKDYLKELYGYSWSTVKERDHSTLVIWSPCLEEFEEPIVVSEPCYSPDILPTLLNLFGIDYEDNIYAGRDILSDEDPLVIWNNSSWLTDMGFYDSLTGKFTIKDGVVLPDADAYVENISSIVRAKIARSREIINKGISSTAQP